MRRRRAIPLGVLIAITAVNGSPLGAQQAARPPVGVTAAVRVNVVNVEVYVVDGEGSPVCGLTAADFELREDGAPVGITNFFAAEAQVPAAQLPAQARISPAVAPEAPPQDEQSLSLVVFVDNANITFVSRKTVLDAVATMLVKALRPGDRVMVVSYDRSLKERRSLTTDPTVAVAAVRALGKESAEGVFTAAQRQRLIDQMAHDASAGAAPPSERGMRPLAPDSFTAVKLLEHIRSFAQQQFDASRSLLKALGQLVDSLAGLPGRKVVLYVSEGIVPRPCEDLFLEWEVNFPQAAEALRRSGQYTSPQIEAGKYSVTSQLSEIGRGANAGRVTFVTVDAAADRGLEGFSAEGRVMTAQPGLAGMAAAIRQESLIGFATATGGRSLVNTPALAETLAEAAEELHSYYSLGYSPGHFGDGKYHGIKVLVRRLGVKVRYREGYLDKPPGQRLLDRTAAALLAEDTRNPLGLAVKVGKPAAGQGKTLLVPLELSVPAARLTLLPHGESVEGQLSVGFVVRDDEGRSSEPQHIPIPVSVARDKLDDFLKRNATFTFQLMMREGKQRVAITVQDSVTEETSTVVTEVNIPSKAFLERRSPF